MLLTDERFPTSLPKARQITIFLGYTVLHTVTEDCLVAHLILVLADR